MIFVIISNEKGKFGRDGIPHRGGPARTVCLGPPSINNENC